MSKDINVVLAELGACANSLPPNRTSTATECVVRCMDGEYPIDAIQVEKFDGAYHDGRQIEPPRTVVAIRIEPEDERDIPLPAVSDEEIELAFLDCAKPPQELVPTHIARSYFVAGYRAALQQGGEE